MHNSEALYRAFDILKSDNDTIMFPDFLEFMKRYNPWMGMSAHTGIHNNVHVISLFSSI